MAELNNVPGGGEVWKVGNKTYLVYDLPGITDAAPIPLLWELRTQEQVEALFGENPIAYDQQLTPEQLRQTGAQVMGIRDEIVNENEHPWAVFEENFARELEIRPWLADPEMFRLIAAANLEGRNVTDAELKTTSWWQSHNEAQRSWMKLREGDPASAQQLLDDNIAEVKKQLRKAGYADAPDEIAKLLGHYWTSGNYSASDVNEQILALTDPYSGAELRPDVANLLDEQGQRDAETRQGEEEVRQLFRSWLGGFGNPSEAKIKEWAGRFRNDPDAETELIEELRRQRLALLPEYENPDLKWDDIAPTWRNFIQQQWGQTVEDDDPVLHKVMRMNDAGEAQTLLRKEGMKRGNKQVKQEAFTGLLRATGGAVIHGKDF